MIHYKDMKGDAKCTKRGGLELRSLKFIGNSTIRQNTYAFLLTLHGNHAPILRHFWDKKWPKLLILIYPACICHPLAVIQLEFRQVISRQKTSLYHRTACLLILCLAHFHRTPNLWWTHGTDTGGHSTTAYTALAWRHTVKTIKHVVFSSLS